MPRFKSFAQMTDGVSPSHAAHSRLSPRPAEGSNPGKLHMLGYVPDTVPPRAPLVVVLHGCTQTAGGFDDASGWSTLADQHGFALLYPEQVRANNVNGCFNWFEPGDTARGSGEVASIAAAVAEMVREHDLDPARVFVTGLSAGGAMAATLLATYPDVFAGGAICAGLAHGSADTVSAAMSAMRMPPESDAQALGDRVRDASTFTGPWPRVVIWHGTADTTVSVANGDALAAQWCDVHGLEASKPVISGSSRDSVRRWRSASGVVQVELHRLDGMGHGTPIAAGKHNAHAAPFMLDVGIDSPSAACAFWGIADAAAKVTPLRPRAAEAVRAAPARVAPVRPAHAGFDVGGVINAALKAAGLMR